MKRLSCPGSTSVYPCLAMAAQQLLHPVGSPLGRQDVGRAVSVRFSWGAAFVLARSPTHARHAAESFSKSEAVAFTKLQRTGGGEKSGEVQRMDVDGCPEMLV